MHHPLSSTKKIKRVKRREGRRGRGEERGNTLKLMGPLTDPVQLILKTKRVTSSLRSISNVKVSFANSNHLLER